jgi:ribonuclease Z
MNPSFSSYLINDVFGDPGVYVEIRWSRRALLFDLGHNDSLGPTRLLRATDIFISHTHMDHFIGFDAVLRVALGRGKTLRLFGPPGLIDNVQGKLRGYTWNLVDGYPLVIEVHEFHPQTIKQAVFHAGNGFLLSAQPDRPAPPHTGTALFTVLDDPMFTVNAVALNHRIPSFAYCSKTIHITSDKRMKRFAGQGWLRSQTYLQGAGRLSIYGRAVDEHRREKQELVLGEVREKFLTISRGQKIAYVVDARYDEENEAKILALAHEADVFYCEAPYLDSDAGKAHDRYHLTARQAGLMARKARVRNLVVFHFSPRYTGQSETLKREAMKEFQGN